MEDMKCRGIGFRNDGIGLPVTEFEALVDLLRTFADEDPLGDYDALVFPIIEVKAASLMFSWKETEKIPSFQINILVNRFVADSQVRVVDRDPASDLLRSPMKCQFFFYVIANLLIFQTEPLCGRLLSLFGFDLGLRGKINRAPENGRSVPLQLPTDRGSVFSKQAPDVSQ